MRLCNTAPALAHCMHTCSAPAEPHADRAEPCRNSMHVLKTSGLWSMGSCLLCYIPYTIVQVAIIRLFKKYLRLTLLCRVVRKKNVHPNRHSTKYIDLRIHAAPATAGPSSRQHLVLGSWRRLLSSILQILHSRKPLLPASIPLT